MEQGFFAPVGGTEHGYPTFILASKKKDGRVHWVWDFCKLNDMLVRPNYPLPCIADIMSHCNVRLTSWRNATLNAYLREIQHEDGSQII